jgi:hypothetical protein
VIELRRIRWVRLVAYIEKMTNNILIKEPDQNRPLGGLRYRPEDNIKMHLKEIKYEGLEWVWMAQNRIQHEELLD